MNKVLLHFNLIYRYDECVNYHQTGPDEYEPELTDYGLGLFRLTGDFNFVWFKSIRHGEYLVEL